MPFTADEIAEIQTVVRQHAAPVALDGIIVEGSWDPTDGTAEFAFGDTLALPVADGANPISHPRLPVLVPAVGEQTGPLGGERAILVRRQSGWAISFEHGPDDSPNAGAGEWVKRHIPSGASVAIRNDNQPSDGAGAYELQGLAKHSQVTSGGLGRVADDNSKTITDTAGPASTVLDSQNQAITHTVGSATAKLDALKQTITHSVGNTQAIVDGNGNAISLIAGITGLGDLASNLVKDPQNAVMAKLHSDKALANVDLQFLTNSSTLVSSLYAHGAFSATFNLGAFLALLVQGFFTSITKADGSQSVFAKR